MSGIDGSAADGPADRPLMDGPLVDGALSPEILAELHAGALDERLAATLRSRLTTDPRSRTVLAALDATVADLAALSRQRAVRMPEKLASRLDAALAAAAASRRNAQRVVPQSRPALRQVHRAGWIAACLPAAAAACMAVLVLFGMRWETAGAPRSADALGTATGINPAPPLALTRASLGSALDEARNSRDLGPLSAPTKLRHCLAANGVREDSAPLGARKVSLDGRPGVLLVLPTGRLAEFRLLVVGPDCGPANPAQLADSVVGDR